MVASRHPSADEMEPYERVLTAAMAGDSTLFARQDYVEEAWRIVDPTADGQWPCAYLRTSYLGPFGSGDYASRWLGQPRA